MKMACSLVNRRKTVCYSSFSSKQFSHILRICKQYIYWEFASNIILRICEQNILKICKQDILRICDQNILKICKQDILRIYTQGILRICTRSKHTTGCTELVKPVADWIYNNSQIKSYALVSSFCSHLYVCDKNYTSKSFKVNSSSFFCHEVVHR